MVEELVVGISQGLATKDCGWGSGWVCTPKSIHTSVPGQNSAFKHLSNNQAAEQ